MQTPQTPAGSSSRYIEEPWSVELSVRDAREEAGSRHHDQQMPTAHAVPADPYTAWLAQREPDRKALLDRLLAHELPDGWDDTLPSWEPDSKALATRSASGRTKH